MSTPNLLIPGKADKERRVFHHTLSGSNLTGTATLVDFVMDDLSVGSGVGPTVIHSPNPGFTHCTRLTHVMVDLLHGGAPPAGNWTLHIAKNEAAAASATFTMTATGLVVVHQKTCGPLDPCIEFDPCDTYHVWATGPTANVILIRVVLRFEEIGGP